MALSGVYKIFNDRWCKQTVWIYSDPHFGDKELAAGIPNRPSDQEQIKMINSKVGKNDTLIILGDVGDVECVKQLRGYKVLICGNHDGGGTNYQREQSEWQFDQRDYTKEQALEAVKKQHPNSKITIIEGFKYERIGRTYKVWMVYADNQLFDEVYTGPLMIGEKILLSHEPINIPFALNIHGHDHSGWEHKDWAHLNVCSDVIGYTPINLNQTLKSGAAAHIQSIHRQTINDAEKRAKKGKKK
jgi:calcineurin-like phosphoesterase family protein